MRGKPVLFDSFAGGLNSAAAPYEVEPDQARDLLNAVGTQRGSTKKRPGSVVFNGAGLADLHGLFASQSKGVFVGSGPLGGTGKLQKITAGGVVSELKTGLSQTARWSFVDAPVSGGQGPVFGMNGTDTPQRWDGAAAGSSDWTAAVGAVPNGRFLVPAGNRLWVAGVAADPSAVFFSNLGDPRDWPAANIVRFAPNDGGDLTAIAPFGPYVLVFKREKAWVVYDLDTGANRELGHGVGCVAHRSIVQTPAGLIFLARDGLYSTDGSTVRKLSDRVQPTLDSVASSEVARAAATYFDHHYLLSFARAGGDPDRTLDFDLELGSFWLHSNICGNEWAVLDVGSGPELFCAGPAALLRTFVAGEPEDAGQAFLGFWASGYHHFGQPSVRKRVRSLHFDGSGLIDVYTAKDFRPGDTLAKTADLRGTDGTWETGLTPGWGVDDGSVFMGTALVSEARAASLGVGRAWSVKFGNETADPWEVDSYTFWLTSRKG